MVSRSRTWPKKVVFIHIKDPESPRQFMLLLSFFGHHGRSGYVRDKYPHLTVSYPTMVSIIIVLLNSEIRLSFLIFLGQKFSRLRGESF